MKFFLDKMLNIHHSSHDCCSTSPSLTSRLTCCLTVSLSSSLSDLPSLCIDLCWCHGLSWCQPCPNDFLSRGWRDTQQNRASLSSLKLFIWLSSLTVSTFFCLFYNLSHLHLCLNATLLIPAAVSAPFFFLTMFFSPLPHLLCSHPFLFYFYPVLWIFYLSLCPSFT